MAADGTVGYWGDPNDVVQSGDTAVGSLISPPRKWPDSFKEAPLKSFMGKKKLNGKRVRLTAAPSSDDVAKAEGVTISPVDSFGNAEAIKASLGLEVIKGFAVFELAAHPDQFVAHKRWWNARSTGVWVDYTPRPDGLAEMVLVESALSTKTTAPLTDELRAAIAARAKLGGLVVAPSSSSPPITNGGGAVASAAQKPPPSTPSPAAKPKKAPPKSPAKLEFTGKEQLGDLVALLSKGTAEAQERAAATIAAQAANGPDESRRLVAAGGLPPLLLLLARPCEAAEHAARALMSVADCVEHQQQIAAAGAVPAVVRLLQPQAPHAVSATMRETAAGILGNLAIQNPANQRAVVAGGALAPLVEMLGAKESACQEQACFALWNLACQNPANQAAIEAAGAIPPLAKLLAKGGAALKEEAAGALMNLAAHADNKRAIAAAGAVAPLVAMLGEGGGAAEQAAGALMNLASNNAANQAAIMEAGALPPLLAMLKGGGGANGADAAASRRAREYVAGALMNLTLKQQAAQAEVAKMGAVALLVAMLKEEEPQMEEVAGALTNLADTHEPNQAAIGASGAIEPLVRLIGAASSPSNREEAAGTLMNLAALDANKPALVAARAVPPLVQLLSDGTDAAREHAAGALANLANGSAERQTAIADAGAIPPLLKMLSHAPPPPPAAPGATPNGTTAASPLGGSQAAAGDVAAASPLDASPPPLCARAASALQLLALPASNAEAIRAARGVPLLVAAMARGVAEAAGVLMNLARAHPPTQDAVVAEGALPLLVQLVSTGTPLAQEEAAGLLAHIMGGAAAGGVPATTPAPSPRHQDAVAAAGAALPLVMLLSFGSTVAARAQGAAALAALAAGHAVNRRAVIEQQAVPTLVLMLKESGGGKGGAAATAGGGAGDKKSDCREEAATCLRWLLEGEPIAQAALVEEGGLFAITALLKDDGTREAASKLLAVFDEGFADAIDTAKA